MIYCLVKRESITSIGKLTKQKRIEPTKALSFLIDILKGETTMKEMARSIVIGGLTVAGLAVAGYRAYELKKLRKAIKEEQIIEIEPEKVEELKQ